MNEGNWNSNDDNNSFSGSLDPTSVNSNSQQDTYRGAWQNGGQNTQDTQNTTGQSSYGEQQQDTWQSEGPQPMPSSDNMYRFQNVNPGYGEKDRQPVEKKKRTSRGFGRTIVSAAVFGVVAAGCFFGILKFNGVRFSGSNGGSISTVDTAQAPSVKAVSGGAVGFGDVSSIVDRVMPSIVAITETSTVSSYFGQTYSTEGAGSGFIVQEDNNELLIVTNNHVVEGADSITVTFIDDSTAKGTVKGTDSTADLAVISVKISDLKDDTKQKIKVASLGHSDDVKVGQMAIAIGNALGYGQSVTVGYISAKDRHVTVGDESSNGSTTMVLLQTDAAINPGNSGGALLDANGNVIGINSVKYADTKVEGIGYAIPMTDAVPIINELMNREVLKDEEKGYLGISGRTVSESLSEAYGFPVGVYVSAVSDNGAAKKAGIKQGDIIVKINDTKITSIQQVQEKVNNTKAGTDITVTIARSQDGEYKEQDVKVTLEGSETLGDLDDGTTGGSNGSSRNDYPYGYGDDFYDRGDSFDGGNQIIPW